MSPHFTVLSQDAGSQARLGLLTTAHGDVETPVFMPVGTVGTVKAQSQEMLEEIGARIILGNAYHLYLRPGHQLIQGVGGLHRFISWPGAILTDSGGFQIYSLSTLRKVDEDGYTFRSHLDGSSHHFTPERAVEIQCAMGSDIAMALDVCLGQPASPEETQAASDRTIRWATRARRCFDDLEFDPTRRPQLFGILQGGLDLDLRRNALEQLVEIGFDGYAIGGLGVGESKEGLYSTVEAVAPRFPADRPRYLMGVGTPLDLIRCAGYGVDMFDCVLPTRNARNGQVFTHCGPLNVKNSIHATDSGPLDEECSCKVCRRYSRAYIRHLYVTGEILSSILCTYHNLQFFLDTLKRVRQSIRLNNFTEFAKSYTEKYLSRSRSCSKEFVNGGSAGLNS